MTGTETGVRSGGLYLGPLRSSESGHREGRVGRVEGTIMHVPTRFGCLGLDGCKPLRRPEAGTAHISR